MAVEIDVFCNGQLASETIDQESNHIMELVEYVMDVALIAEIQPSVGIRNCIHVDA